MDSTNNTISFFIICIMSFSIMALNGCSTNNADTILSQYIEENYQSTTDTLPVIDLKEVFDADFDDIYIFDGYSSPECVDIFVKNESKEITSDFIYGNEDELMVLTKQKKIIKQYRLRHENIFILGLDTISKHTTFDGNTLVIHARHTDKSIFSIQKISNKKYNLSCKKHICPRTTD